MFPIERQFIHQENLTLAITLCDFLIFVIELFNYIACNPDMMMPISLGQGHFCLSFPIFSWILSQKHDFEILNISASNIQIIVPSKAGALLRTT